MTKQGYFQQKFTKSIHSCSNEYRNQKASDSVKVQNEKNSTQNLTPKWKKLILCNYAFVFTNTMKKKRSVSNFLHSCLNNIWAPGSRLVYISKKRTFILLFAGQKYISSTSRATNEQMQNGGQSLTFKKNYCAKSSRTSEEGCLWKENMKTEQMVFRSNHQTFSSLIETKTNLMTHKQRK